MPSLHSRKLTFILGVVHHLFSACASWPGEALHPPFGAQEPVQIHWLGMGSLASPW